MAKKIEKILSRILLVVGTICLSAATVLVFASVIARYFFGVSFDWLEETCRYLCVFSAFTLCGNVFFWNSDVTMEFVVNKIKAPKKKLLLQIVVAIIMIVTAGMLAVFGWQTWAGAAGMKTYSTIFPMQLPYSFLPLGMTLVVIFAILKLIVMIRDRNVEYFKTLNAEIENELEEEIEETEKKLEEAEEKAGDTGEEKGGSGS